MYKNIILTSKTKLSSLNVGLVSFECTSQPFVLVYTAENAENTDVQIIMFF